jgi:hypothetical protein
VRTHASYGPTGTWGPRNLFRLRTTKSSEKRNKTPYASVVQYMFQRANMFWEKIRHALSCDTV